MRIRQHLFKDDEKNSHLIPLDLWNGESIILFMMRWHWYLWMSFAWKNDFLFGSYFKRKLTSFHIWTVHFLQSCVFSHSKFGCNQIVKRFFFHSRNKFKLSLQPTHEWKWSYPSIDCIICTITKRNERKKCSSLIELDLRVSKEKKTIPNGINIESIQNDTS